MDFTYWRSADDSVIQQLPYHIAEWVAEFGSLTQKLSHYADPVRLELLKEATDIATENEQQLLGLTKRSQSQIREVTLYGPSQPWIYARTVVPVANKELLTELGEKPLGSILFTSSELRRQSLEVRQLQQGDELFEEALLQVTGNEKSEYLWARRSVWGSGETDDDKKSNKLLLVEVFLPDSPLYDK
ncbi:chorismate--pyruvate lyase family protein [Kangiella sediminilitoris]|uniref:Probable chorismate pyruvate-lyase n=1 Tax=Kangiella sediminilitoris TaxID=1144748 RepID=A0A1B3B7P0_9GAMM|nr:chorismate lyase [Kangiella sediminilitoris]AOE48815.1 putative chorismate pyruvate-lyase [Kangiella sediminilitoris]